MKLIGKTIEEVESIILIQRNTQEKNELQLYLNSTDWYVIRRSEEGKPVPEEVTTKRLAAKVRLNELK